MPIVKDEMTLYWPNNWSCLPYREHWHEGKRTNSLSPSGEATDDWMNNVAHSFPWAGLLETAQVTAHNKRPHLTAYVCSSVTTTQMAKCVFSEGSPWPNTHGTNRFRPAVCTMFFFWTTSRGFTVQSFKSSPFTERTPVSDVSGAACSVSPALPFLRAHRPGWGAPPAPKPQR